MLRPISSYAHELRPDLSAQAFAPAHSRLLWLPAHAAVIASATIAIASGRVASLVVVSLSIAIGLSFASLTFLAHETLHGSVVRGRRLRHVIGELCFLPLCISPRLWVVWHNHVHHGHTGHAGEDPDAYPTLEDYSRRLHVRVATDHFSMGRGHRGGALTLLLGFTIQSAEMLVGWRRLGMSAKDFRLALLESSLAIAVWTTLAAKIGLVPFFFAFGIPLVIANAIVMAFILTNHSLSPLTDVNDPLVNSLSVTAPRWVEWVTLGFGFHVEHHLFPAMSSRRAPEVRDLLVARWPDRYQSMPIGRALLTIARTGRVYKDAATLLDPRSGHEWPALGSPAALPRASYPAARAADRRWAAGEAGAGSSAGAGAAGDAAAASSRAASGRAAAADAARAGSGGAATAYAGAGRAAATNAAAADAAAADAARAGPSAAASAACAATRRSTA